MSFSLQALEAALSSIEDVGKGETTFDVAGVPVTLRALLPEEEVAVQRFAREAVKADDPNDAVAYLDKFKVEVIAHSLVQVGDSDFREAAFIETGEKLADGKPIQIPRASALRGLILRWTGNLRSMVFRKYHALLQRLEKESDAAVQFEPSDLDTEIERLKEKLKELEEKKEARANEGNALRGAFNQKVEGIIEFDDTLDLDKALQREHAEAQKAADEGTPSPVLGSGYNKKSPPAEPEPPVVPQERRPISPASVAPPLPRKLPVEGEGPPTDTEIAAYWDRGSLVDPDNMEEAVAAEERRLLAARRGRSLPPPPSAITAALQARGAPVPPPHAAAAAVAARLEEEEALLQQAQMRSLGPVEGVEAFALPAEELGRPTAPRVPPVNQNQSNQGTQNPRFRPPTKGM